jgi:hypothetical protein
MSGSAYMAIRPDRLPPTQIAELFAVVNGHREASESERCEAIAQLLREFRSQCEQAGREIDDYEKTRAAVVGTAEAAPMITAACITAELDALAPGRLIDPLLVQGVKAWAFQIFRQPNPIAALEKLLGIRRRRGKRAKNTERDFWIAVAVAEKMKSDMTLEKASYEIAEAWGLKDENVRKIYTRNLVEAKAQAELMAIDKLVTPEAAAAESAEDTECRQTEAARKTENSDHVDPALET